MDINKNQKKFAERPTFFPCKFCRGMFTARALELHIKSCFKIPSEDTSNTNIKKIEMIKDENKQYKCKFCTKTFKQFFQLKRHISSKICRNIKSKCKDKSKVESNVGKSVILNNQPTDKSCSNHPISQNKSTDNKKKLSEHFPCKICHLVFAHKLDLQKHLKSHKLHDKDVKLNVNHHDSIFPSDTDSSSTNECDSIETTSANIDMTDSYCDIIEESELNNSSNSKAIHSARTSVIVRSRNLMCDKCGLTFITKYDYDKHYPVHKDKIECCVCKESISQESYGQHIIMQHSIAGNGQFLKCAHCSQGFLNATLLLVHYRLHIHDNKFFCSECHKKFTQAIDLKFHTLSVHGHLELQPYHCYICLRKFSQPHAIINHMRLHTGEMPFQCQECGRAFTQLGNLQRHLNMHRGERPHKCQVCEKAFTDPATLRNHIRTHTGETPFVCKVCTRAFSQIGNLKRHMSKHVSLKPHACPDCGKCFAHESTLRNHRRIHTGEQPFKCTICSRAFSQIGNLKRHMAKHALQQDFQCGQCSKNFNTSQELVQHECTCVKDTPEETTKLEEENSSELPVPCHMITQWPKCTSQSKKMLRKLAMEAAAVAEQEKKIMENDLSSNKIIEENEKSLEDQCLNASTTSAEKNEAISRKWRIFPCPICGKVYTWQYDLKIHYRVHSGEKPYKCEICGKGFAQSGAVKTHKARHHQYEASTISDSPKSPQEHIIEIEPATILV